MQKIYLKRIIWKEKEEKERILQIYKKGLEYAFLSDNNIQCMNFVLCKDFLQDVIFSIIHNKAIYYYNFRYNPYTDPLASLNKTRLLLTNAKDSKFSDKITNCVDFLSQIENSLKIKPTTVRLCKDPPNDYKKSGVWLFEGSKRWLTSPHMISLYSLLLRIGFVHEAGNTFETTIQKVINGDIKPYQTKDKDQLKKAYPVIAKILKNGDRQFFGRNMLKNYPLEKGVERIHNMGIVYFAENHEKQ